ncbi:MAG: hypothetical protein ACKPKO_39865, partial [Candidatus Fonsibacter sp.]
QVRSILLKQSKPYEVGGVARMQIVVQGQEASLQREIQIRDRGGGGRYDNAEQRHDAPISLLKKNFTHNYCKTCHSFQGNTIEESITIFGHKFAYVSRKWLYTAVAKATNLKQVYFYDYDESAENKKEMILYLATKVENYRLQDKKANRSIDNGSFVTKEWLMGCVGKSCGDCLTYSRSHGR